MAKRALLIGSQTGGLTGVHADVELMDRALTAAGFTCRSVTGSAATRAGILAAYRDLIEDTRKGDAVVTFYSGHGGREPNTERTPGSLEPPWLQYIVPTDIDDRSGDEFRGVLAAELSALQVELTARTRNVTTIVDCCHAARMFRREKVRPKADPSLVFPWASVQARWAALRRRADVGSSDANPHAVQIVACQPDEAAYEVPLPGGRGSQGALTVALAEVLRSRSVAAMNWREVLGVVQRRVAGVVAMQTPGVAGSTSATDRLVFSLEEKRSTGVLPVLVDRGAAWLLDADLLGLAAGDSYALVRPGGDPRRPRTMATIDRITSGRARLALARGRASQLPAGVAAHPVSTGLSRRPVAVVPQGHPARRTVGDAVGKRADARVVVKRPGALVVVKLGDAGATLADAEGLALTDEPIELSPEGLEELVQSVRTLARADYLRELASGEGDDELPDDVEVSFARLEPASPSGEEPLARSGEHLFVGDRFVVRAVNRSDQRRYVSVLDIGLRGGIFLITDAERTGVTLDPGETYVVGEGATHALSGIELFWPDDLPPEGPRPESYVVLVADARVEGLPSLAQPGLTPREPGWETSLSGLERLIADGGAGRREGRLVDPPVKPTRYRVRRLDFLLHSTSRPSMPAQPRFHIDTAADPSFRLVVPRSGIAPPRRLTVRLADLRLLDGSSLAGGRGSGAQAVRIDTLVVTAAAGDDGGDPFQTRTLILDAAAAALDDVVLFDGPVSRFVDVAVWLSTAPGPVIALDELLAPGLARPPGAEAVDTLVRLRAPDPPAALVAGAEAAVATLVRSAADVLDAASEINVGVYRTTLLPHDRFGAGLPGQFGPDGRRLPAAGTIRTRDAELVFEIVGRSA